MKEETKKEMLKYFSAVLRKHSKEDFRPTKIENAVLYFLNRKDLISIVNEVHDNKIPGNTDLAFLENKELLGMIDNEIQIVSYMLSKYFKSNPADGTEFSQLNLGDMDE